MTNRVIPALLILRLDYTLWSISTDYDVVFPCRPVGNGSVIDTAGNIINCYPEVDVVFETLKNINMTVAVIEDVSDVNNTIQLINAFGWDKYISFIEVGPENTTDYIKNLHEKTKVPYDQMVVFYNRDVYFDIPKEYIKQGVFIKHAYNYQGISMKALDEGIKEYDMKKRGIKPQKTPNLRDVDIPEY